MQFGAALRHFLACLFFPLLAVAQSSPSDSLWAQATLYRDEWGVPHVFADTPQAMGFVFGYAQAEDHLEPMLMAYRVAAGRAAEIGGEAYVDSDIFALKMGHDRLAREALPQLDPMIQALCAGFAQGVNRWIVEHPAQTPPWADGVQAHEPLALWHAYMLSTAPLDLPNAPTRPPAATTGNAWALAPARSASGHAMLVINPHQYHDGPFRWYEAHLSLGGADVAGATLFGLPVLLVGHNQVLGWALTPNAPDFADIFIEELNMPQQNANDPSLASNTDKQALLLLYMSQAQIYHVRTKNGMEQRAVPALVSERGPVFDYKTNQLATWRIGGFRDFGGFGQLLAMGRAQSMEEFDSALRMQQLPCFNITYADAAGNIFTLYNAKVGGKDVPAEAVAVARQQGYRMDWTQPLPVGLDSFAWTVPVTLDSLPRVTNPESGYVQACGSPPWLATDNALIAADGWPAWFVTEPDSYRAQRARQLLRNGTRTLYDNQSMLYDVVAPAATEMVPILLAFADARREQVAASHPDLLAGLELLSRWSYTADTSSPAMTFYHVWWNLLQTRAQKEFPGTQAVYAAMQQKTPASLDLALSAAADAARTLRNDFRELNIPWGDVHRIRRGDRDEPMAGGGTGEPIFVASEGPLHDGKWPTAYGYGFAMAIEFGDTPQTLSLAPFGASEDPRSPHYSDQLDLMLERRMKKTRFQRDDVLRHASLARGTRIGLQPLGVEGKVLLEAPAMIEARLETLVDAPAPLPEGLAPFTLFLRPRFAPAEMPVQTSLSVEVPQILCAPENRPALKLYRYTEERGWEPVPQQLADARTGSFSASEQGAAVYAVLGPREHLEALPVVPGVLSGEEEVAASMPLPAEAPGAAPPAAVEPEILAAEEQGKPKRKFKFDRLDFDFLSGKSEEEKQKRDKDGKLFFFERLDKPAQPTQPHDGAEVAAPAVAPELAPSISGGGGAGNRGQFGGGQIPGGAKRPEPQSGAPVQVRRPKN